MNFSIIKIEPALKAPYIQATDLKSQKNLWKNKSQNVIKKHVLQQDPFYLQTNSDWLTILRPIRSK